MAVTLADTDVLIDFLAGAEPVKSQLVALVGGGGLITSVISSFELLSGARSGPAGEKVRKLVATLPVMPLQPADAERAAQVRRTLDSQGRSIGMADSLIAGIALQHDLALFTRNRKHFERVEGLSLVNLKP